MIMIMMIFKAVLLIVIKKKKLHNLINFKVKLFKKQPIPILQQMKINLLKKVLIKNI